MEHIGVLQSDLGLGTRWLTQMGDAARRYGLTIQYCMALPRHVLSAVLIPAVTQVRYAYQLQLSHIHPRLVAVFQLNMIATPPIDSI